MSRLTLYSREGCHLCDEMLAALAPWLLRHGTTVEVLDVDADPIVRRRFGHKVPVLLVDGEPVSSAALDPEALERAWRDGG